MSCESIDLKEYFFGEASLEDRRLAEGHLSACGTCRDELSRLQLTQAALGSLRDEELPRRIAFVSDKVFEPRWYRRLWRSGPQLGFIGAGLLSCAILVHAFVQPAVPAAPMVTAVADQATIDRAVAERVEQAVVKAVADIEARQRKKTVEMLQAADRKHDLDRRATLEAISAQTSLIMRMQGRDYAVANNLTSGGQ